jgi:A/G-specific adenine glycosylase
MLHDDQIRTVREILPKWFGTNARDLPWRREYRPYQVWISEIMLQQTQMERGVAYYRRWMARFPDIRDVARAEEQEILNLWEGLGYYSRARNIRKAAEIIMEKHAGEFPTDHEDILALPGIGPYTAGAICSIAFEQDLVAVDANVERILARLGDLNAPLSASGLRERLRTTARALLPSGQARMFNQALMEFGALVCTPKTPACAGCPLTDVCLARKSGTVSQRPVPAPKKGITPLTMAAAILTRDGKIAVRKRPATGLWPNMWEFPCMNIEPGQDPGREILKEVRRTVGHVPGLTPDLLAVITHVYTRYRVTLHGYVCPLPAEAFFVGDHPDCRWIAPLTLDDHPFSSGHRKLIDRLRRDLRHAGLFAG